MGSSRVSSWNPEETPAAPFGKLHGSFHSAAEITDAAVMEPAWHLRGTLAQPSWNLHVNLHGHLHEPAWEPSLNHHGNFYGALMGFSWESSCLHVAVVEHSWNLHGSQATSIALPFKLHGNLHGTFMGTLQERSWQPSSCPDDAIDTIVGPAWEPFMPSSSNLDRTFI